MALFVLTGCGGVVSPTSPSSPAAIHNEWTWMGGSNIANQPGNYGTLGTPAPGNIPPNRWYAASWVDSSGNLWLFGGDLITSPLPLASVESSSTTCGSSALPRMSGSG
jgi:hypothetical protein